MSAVLGVSPQSGSRLSRQSLDATEIEMLEAAEAAGIKGRFTTTMTRVMTDQRSKQNRGVRKKKVSR